MKNTKRLLALALVLCMAISMMVLSASAELDQSVWPGYDYFPDNWPGHADFVCLNSGGDHIYVIDVMGSPNMTDPSQNKIRSFVTVGHKSEFVVPKNPCPYCPDLPVDYPGHLIELHDHSFRTVSNETERAVIQQSFLDPVVPGMWYKIIYFTNGTIGYKACNSIHVGRGWNDMPVTVSFVNNGDCDFKLGACEYYPAPTYWPDDFDPFGTPGPTTTPAPKKQPKTGVADALPLWVSFMSASAGAYVLTSKKKRS